jgi:hypothetical protein
MFRIADSEEEPCPKNILPDGFHYADKLTLDQLYEAEEFARQQDSLLALRNVREHIELRLDGPEEASP